MHERTVAALLDVEREIQHKPGCQPLPAVRVVGADRADLGPTLRLQPFARHCHEPPLATEPDVAPEFMCARQEGARLVASDQRQHLRHVGLPEDESFCVRHGAERFRFDELHSFAAPQLLPAIGELGHIAGQTDLGSVPDQGDQ
jgi:hypothetical protein